MTSSQDSLGRLDDARRGLRTALKALEQIPDIDVPRVTNDGIQHQLHELEQRLRALHDDLAPVRKQTGPDRG